MKLSALVQVANTPPLVGASPERERPRARRATSGLTSIKLQCGSPRASVELLARRPGLHLHQRVRPGAWALNAGSLRARSTVGALFARPALFPPRTSASFLSLRRGGASAWGRDIPFSRARGGRGVVEGSARRGGRGRARGARPQAGEGRCRACTADLVHCTAPLGCPASTLSSCPSTRAERVAASEPDPRALPLSACRPGRARRTACELCTVQSALPVPRSSRPRREPKLPTELPLRERSPSDFIVVAEPVPLSAFHHSLSTSSIRTTSFQLRASHLDEQRVMPSRPSRPRAYTIPLEPTLRQPVEHECVEGRSRRISWRNPLGLPAPLTWKQVRRPCPPHILPLLLLVVLTSRSSPSRSSTSSGRR